MARAYGADDYVSPEVMNAMQQAEAENAQANVIAYANAGRKPVDTKK